MVISWLCKITFFLVLFCRNHVEQFIVLPFKIYKVCHVLPYSGS